MVLLQPLQLLQLPAAMPPTKAQIRQDLGQGNSGTISCCQSQPRTAVLTCKAKQYWRAASWQSSHSMGTPPSWASGLQDPLQSMMQLWARYGHTCQTCKCPCHSPVLQYLAHVRGKRSPVRQIFFVQDETGPL